MTIQKYQVKVGYANLSNKIEGKEQIIILKLESKKQVSILFREEYQTITIVFKILNKNLRMLLLKEILVKLEANQDCHYKTI